MRLHVALQLDCEHARIVVPYQWASRAVPLALLLALLVTSASASDDARPTPPSPVDIHAEAEPAIVTIGTPFRYTVEVVTGPEVEVVLSQPTESIGDFEIIDFGDEPPTGRDGKTVVTRWYTLVGFETGERLVKSPPVFYRRAGEGLEQAPQHEIVVSVESLLARAGDAADIRDIKAPEEFPVDWRPYYLVGGALAVLVALAFVLYRVLNRTRRAALAPPPRPAHEIALAELERLRRQRLIEAGSYKEYYTTLSGIVRSYIEQRFNVRAPEMTTEEFLLNSARNGSLQSGHRSLLANFLTESDLVKFARHVPTIANSESAYAAAKRFIDETAVGRLPAPGTREAESLRATG